MRSKEEVAEMLDLFDAAYEADELESEGESIREALQWVQGHHSNTDLEMYLPEADEDEDED